MPSASLKWEFFEPKDRSVAMLQLLGKMKWKLKLFGMMAFFVTACGEEEEVPVAAV